MFSIKGGRCRRLRRKAGERGKEEENRNALQTPIVTRQYTYS